MTQTHGAATSAAKKGNKLFDYNEAIQKQGSLSSLGMGAMAALVPSGAKPGYILLGGVTGIVAQQAVSQIGVQQIGGFSSMTGNIVAGGLGTLTYFGSRWTKSASFQSWAFGNGIAMVAPLIAQLTQYGVTWFANLLRPATTTPASGGAKVTGTQQNLGNQQRTTIDASTVTTVAKIRARAA